MHEAAAMQGMVRTVLECLQKAGGARVTNVQLVLCASGHLTADAAYQHFEALTKGTHAEKASLTIQWLPTTYQCLSCLHRFESCDGSVCRAERSGAGLGAYVVAERSGADRASGAGDIALLGGGEPSAQVTCPKCGDEALEIDHRDVCYVSAIDVSYDEETANTLEGVDECV